MGEGGGPSSAAGGKAELLAAELALGLLEGDERHRAECMQTQYPDFAALVEKWRIRARNLVAARREVPAPGWLWARIEARLGMRPADAQCHEPRPRVSPVAEREPAGEAAVWKRVALAASLAVLVLAGLWAFQPPRIVEAPRDRARALRSLSVAQIPGERDAPLLSALFDRTTGMLYVQLGEIADPGRVPQLWLVGGGGTPLSLGSGRRDGAMELQLSGRQRETAARGGSIAVSLEQPSRSPADRPTDVVGVAAFTAVYPATGAPAG